MVKNEDQLKQLEQILNKANIKQMTPTIKKVLVDIAEGKDLKWLFDQTSGFKNYDFLPNDIKYDLINDILEPIFLTDEYYDLLRKLFFGL